MFKTVLFLFSGISIFLYGLKTISRGTEQIIMQTNTRVITKFVKRPLCGTLIGLLVAGLTQSSVAVSFITVSLVDLGVVSFLSSAPIIMGANVGTTVTAQLISFYGGSGAIIGAISSIIGLLASFFKNKWVKMTSEIAIGLGLIFVGLNIMDGEISHLANHLWFKKLFLIKGPIALFLNGLVITGIVQSSSAVTGIMIMLANKGLVDFNSAIFLTLGANVGSCMSVIVASLNKSLQARRTSVFNLVFNLLGAVIFFPIAIYGADFLSGMFLSDCKEIARAIANFHTVFNLSCALLFLPFSKYITLLIAKLVDDKPKELCYKVNNKTFTSKSRRFN